MDLEVPGKKEERRGKKDKFDIFQRAQSRARFVDTGFQAEPVTLYVSGLRLKADN